MSQRKFSEVQVCLFFFLINLFLDRGEGREKERERNINVWLPLTCHLLGTWPATQACALTGNGTSHPLVHRPALYAVSHTSQGCRCIFKVYANSVLYYITYNILLACFKITSLGGKNFQIFPTCLMG